LPVITTSMTLFLSTRVAVATLLPAWMAPDVRRHPWILHVGCREGMDYKIVVHSTGPSSLDVSRLKVGRERERE
jgi:hypothetical protein